ncbi:MAG TPA: hypothetical protein VE732_02015 [Nitrososphaera sp.]|jgi:hypothetical protein|nr:hypothetical protein [Nitrososphaera sp.]
MEVNQNCWIKFTFSLTIILLSSALYVIQAQDRPWLNPTRPNNCEDALALLETAALDARKDKESYIIVIARLGDGEKSQSLNRRRVGSAIPYLGSRAGNKIVAASGEKVSGYGRLELYVRGRLVYVIAFPRNRLIDCSGLG